MARRLNWRVIKRHRNYTVDDVSRVLNVAKGTVRHWLKFGGLQALRDQKPALILGSDLIDFLKGRQKPRQRCELDECYCFSCRVPRRPAFEAVEFTPLSPVTGDICGLCSHCSTVMHKRVAIAKLPALQAMLDVQIKQADGHLDDTD